MRKIRAILRTRLLILMLKITFCYFCEQINIFILQKQQKFV